MKPKSTLRSFLFVAGSSLLAISSASAATGTWNVDANGLWSAAGNWTPGVADGAGFIANFTNNITADRTVSLDSDRTINRVNFADSTTSSAGSWILDNNGTATNNLILSGTTGAATGTVPVIDVAALGSGKTATISAIIEGSYGFTKTGAGTLVLSGANTYTGTTTLSAGTLALSGGDNRLLSTSTLALTGASTLDIGSTSQTLAAITVPDNGNFTSAINGSGGTLTINGASDLQWGPGGTIVGGNAIVVNLSGLSNFVYNSAANIFRVGYKSGATNSGTNAATSTVTLAGSNTITAATLGVGDQTGGNRAGLATLRLGAANTLNVANINIGFSSRSNATLDFAAASSAVTIRNTDGTSAVSTWNIGSVNNPSTAFLTFTDAVDLSNGTIDALVTSMIIGQSAIGTGTTRTGITNASFTMGASTGVGLTVNTMTLGNSTGSSGSTVSNTLAANGTFTLNSASGIANITTLTLATNTTLATGGTRIVSGTFNLTNGTLNATTVQKGLQTGTATATVAFNWGTGTIGNLTGTNLTWTDIPITLSAGTHNFDISGSNTATLNSASVISGATFGITKIGSGTLNLSAANTYSGATAVNAGTLTVSGSGSINNTGAINVAAGGTLRYNSSTALTVAPTLAGSGTSNRAVLGGTGPINASVTLNNLGDVLSPGNSPGIQTYTIGQTWASFSYDWEVNDFDGLTAGTHYDQIAITNTLNLTGGSGSYILNILSLTAGNVDGLVPDFSEINRSWTILTSTGITGFNALNWTLVTDPAGPGAFTSSPAWGGTWALAQSGNDLVLSYTAVPEPRAALLGGIGLLMLLRRRRR
jgi:fibronectin-binding autotransporter adhesin